MIESRRRGGTQPDPLSLDDLIDAALELTERNGLDALTVKAVADELGITSPAVYHYVDGKRELIERLCERVTRRVDLTVDNDGDWQDNVVALVTRLDAAFARYPGVAARALSTVGPAPGSLRINEAILLQLTRAGFARADAIEMVAALHFLFSGWLLGRSPAVDEHGMRAEPLAAEVLQRTARRLLQGYAGALLH
ncbi:MAG: helix-turn-helix domain-containing protein [Actinomycetota bacterium]|nr:helix-turn-helix domain-containing protein [Actinomycetota bacterium]